MTDFQISGFVPFMSVRGNYEGSGKFLLLQVTGSGDGEIKYCTYTQVVHNYNSEKWYRLNYISTIFFR